MSHAYPAPAKLNLFLHVVGRRADGYHLLQSVFRLIDRADTVHLELRDDGRVIREGDLPGVQEDHDLTVRAARLLQAHAPDGAGVSIRLDKILPMGGGHGGGSSDAATGLLAHNRLQLGLRSRLFWAHDPRSLQEAVAGILSYSPQLLIIIESSLMVGNRRSLTSTAIQAKIPLVAEDASFAEAGAFFSYGASSRDSYRRAASYVDKIVKGTRTGELPIEQPTRFEYVLNATTADRLRVKVPQSVLFRADRVIR